MVVILITPLIFTSMNQGSLVAECVSEVISSLAIVSVVLWREKWCQGLILKWIRSLRLLRIQQMSISCWMIRFFLISGLFAINSSISLNNQRIMFFSRSRPSS